MKRISFILIQILLLAATAEAQNFQGSFLSTNTLYMTKGDMDGDGDMDVVGGGLRNLYWEENIGNGNFVNRVISQSQQEVQGIVTVDLDQDGYLDIVTASLANNAVYWCRNNGSQTFAQNALATGITGCVFVDAGDMDNDGDIDIVGAAFTGDKIFWLRNNGSQSFTTIDIATGIDGALRVDAADFDNDGDLDIAAAAREGDQILMYTNNGNATFTSTLLDTFNAPRDIRARDYDQDGDMDLLFAGDDGYGWFKNNGGSYTQLFYSTSSVVRCIDVADFNQDGILDLASADFTNEFVVASIMSATQTFVTSSVIDYGTDSPAFLALHDFTGDGRIDIMAASNFDTRLQRNGAGLVWTAVALNKYLGNANGACHGDFDNDGDIDLMAVGFLNLIWYRNEQNGEFTPIRMQEYLGSWITTDDGVYMRAGDLDNDGDDDVVFTENDNNSVTWLENIGGGNFTVNPIIGISTPYSLEIVDFNMDGDKDIVVSSTGNNAVYWYENNGSEVFTQHLVSGEYFDPFETRTLDYDEDGDMDVLVAQGTPSDKILMFVNNGNDLAFTNRVIDNSSLGANSVFAIDVDDDGDVDLFSASSEDNRIVMYRNNGAVYPIYTEVAVATGVDGATYVYGDDYDGDGDIDLVSTSLTDRTIDIYINDGTEDFSRVALAQTIEDSQFVESGDLDGDGIPEIYGVGGTHGLVQIFKMVPYVAPPAVDIAPCSELFISEVVEGSSWNKSIEIYNPSSAPINLSNYRIEIYANGGTQPSQSLALGGTLDPDDVYVVSHNLSDLEFYFAADIDYGWQFNGDDAIVLTKNGDIIDMVGVIGQDPGTGWAGSNGGNTVDRTIVRKPEITRGYNAALQTFDVDQEWIVYPIDAWQYIGNHTGLCASACIPSVTITSTSASICAGTSVTFTASIVEGGTSPAYQWKKNNINVGTNAATYTDSNLSDNDNIKCVLTTNAECSLVSNVTSNTITMNVDASVTPSVSITTSSNTICTGSSAVFTATAVNGGTSPVYQWKKNGGNVGTNASTYNATGLVNGDIVSCTITSNANCTTTTIANSNTITMTVVNSFTPAVSITSTTNTICAGTSVTFTATPVNGGAAPAYQWKRNGSNLGTNSATYTNATWTNGDIITVVMTSNASCLSAPTATSNGITMAVTANVTPSVSITASTNNICPGTSITFTATPVNGGSTPSYQWKRNGSNVGTNSATYTNATWNNGDIVSCTITSTASCVTSTTANSNNITVTVTAAVTPSLSLSSSTTTTCANGLVVFTAFGNNGGASPSYVWRKNGTIVSTNGNGYSASSWANGDQIYCTMTTSLGCVTTTTAVSNTITLTVTPTVTPTISIAANNNNICAGTTVVFTASPTNGGASPAYQWKRNGNNVGTNSATYSSAVLNNGDVITCTLTSNAACASVTSLTSNSVTMSVNPVVTPAVSIAASQTTICGPQSITFTATPNNQGATPVYQWKRNGSNVGTNAPTYTNTTWNNGDIITCQLTGSATCGTSTVNSNAVTITVSSIVTPSVSIQANATQICATGSLTFTASPVNGGSAPSYVWTVNGQIQTTTSNTYTDSGWADGDEVVCSMVSNAACTSTSVATSNTFIVDVVSAVTPAVAISASTNDVCIGTTIAFNASATNGGANPTYQWKRNGNNVGNNSSIYTSSTLTDGDIITCVITSNAPCASTTTATSNSVIMNIIDGIVPTVTIEANNTTLCEGQVAVFAATVVDGGSAPTYQWQVNGGNVGQNIPTFSSSSLDDEDEVTCIVTSNGACAGDPGTSNVITMNVTSIITPVIYSEFGTLVIAPVAGAAYQWFLNGDPIDGANTWNYSPSESGAYSVEVSLNGCSEESAEYDFIFIGLEKNDVPTVSVYPNPSRDVVFVTGIEAPMKVVVFNSIGELVDTSMSKQIDVSRYANGVYHFHITYGDINDIIRVVVSK